MRSPTVQRWQNPPRPLLPNRAGCDALALLCRMAARAYDPDDPRTDFSIEDLDDLTQWRFERLDAAIRCALTEGLLDRRTTLPGDRVAYSLAEEEAP